MTRKQAVKLFDDLDSDFRRVFGIFGILFVASSTSMVLEVLRKFIFKGVSNEKNN